MHADAAGTPLRVLITGAAGLVGAHLAAAYREHQVFALRHRDLDIGDARAVDETAQRLRPDVIFNCAVIGVDDCEADPALAERVNVTGPAQLAAAAERLGAAMVHFSSNYVFDGGRDDGVPYATEDAAHPINVYGATKVRGEQAVAAAATRAFIVRTSWVFGVNKNGFLSTVAARLARGERVQAIGDTFASTTFVRDLVARVIEIVARGHAGTYQIVNDGVCSYETFAREAARIIGLGDDAAQALIEPSTEASLSRLAPRPRWTPMRCTLSEQLGLSPMRPWQQALAAFLSE
ncbi:MAG TPA: dTDP-4-dehydrorhamnose reductase [Thermoanaerobaculia bacterium]|nr:dTDP-4-dehydrorhamnose reductase [Thermoanaerobaculia bacterium]